MEKRGRRLVSPPDIESADAQAAAAAATAQVKVVGRRRRKVSVRVAGWRRASVRRRAEPSTSECSSANVPPCGVDNADAAGAGGAAGRRGGAARRRRHPRADFGRGARHQPVLALRIPHHQHARRAAQRLRALALQRAHCGDFPASLPRSKLKKKM